MSDVAYDEFAYFADNASEVGLSYPEPPTVERVELEVETGRVLSALRWGDAEPELVLLHGGAQNAHTWDTVALALDRPLLAIDLPGHGHSDWRPDRAYWPDENALAIGTMVAAMAPDASAIVGMSLGGLTALALSAQSPELVRKLALVDVTPGVNRDKASAIAAFVSGPETFATFDEILERTVAFNPTRSESSLRRGILHNATARPDGSWSWRYDRFIPEADAPLPDFGDLWEAVDAVTVPFMLARGADSPVVDDADVAELRRRAPGVKVEVVNEAGHSIQGDQPLVLAALLTEFVG